MVVSVAVLVSVVSVAAPVSVEVSVVTVGAGAVGVVVSSRDPPQAPATSINEVTAAATRTDLRAM
ncbi:MAG TPA: hypothetical protein VES40_17190 [Ilumatobacteraceae bacterium]|nr:hypothetical protein [Ilumatobacteraceae bacterium]